MQNEMLDMEERLRQQTAKAAAAMANQELLREQDASGRVSSPNTPSTGSYVVPWQSGPEGAEDAHMAPPWITTADSLKSSELQQSVSRRETELKDKEKALEAQRMEFRYAQSQLRAAPGVAQAGSVAPRNAHMMNILNIP